MSIYRVVRYREARWDRQEPSYVEADSEADAARKVCGEGPITTGRARDLRVVLQFTERPRIWKSAARLLRALKNCVRRLHLFPRWRT